VFITSEVFVPLKYLTKVNLQDNICISKNFENSSLSHHLPDIVSKTCANCNTHNLCETFKKFLDKIDSQNLKTIELQKMLEITEENLERVQEKAKETRSENFHNLKLELQKMEILFEKELEKVQNEIEEMKNGQVADSLSWILLIYSTTLVMGLFFLFII
jgi:predicted phage tail protein